MHNYHQAYDVFPMAQSLGPYDGRGDSWTWNDWSAQAMLLGYLEQQPVFNAINFQWAPLTAIPDTDAINTTAFCLRLGLFLCPSDSDTSIGSNNNYCVSLGTTPNPFLSQSTGLFAGQVSYGVRDCADGTSATIALSERVKGEPNDPANGYRGNGVLGLPDNPAWWIRDSNQDVNGTLQLFRACNRVYQTDPTGGQAYNYGGWRWAWGTPAMSCFTTHIPPNSTEYPWASCGQGCATCGVDGSNFANATSFHPGGCNVAFGDGSARFVKSSVDMRAWWALGTRSGGEVLSADAY
jgi:prepilin-type processing-associated H-X9-DG protein